MTERPELTDLRREQVKRAALECLVEYGFASLSVKDIARHAGVSTGILYHYFVNKNDILLQALAMAFREADAALRDQVENAPNTGSGGRLPRYLRAAATMGRDHREATQALLAALGHTGASDEVRHRLARLFADFRGYAHDLLLEDAGEVSVPARESMQSQAPTEVAAALIVAMGIGLACQWAVDPEAVNADAAARAFQRLWRTGGAVSAEWDWPAATERCVRGSTDEDDSRGGL
ncbi:MAG: TetR/AcrR family transcriptional regulator [Thermaerobacter sp.]|nr:TetR/AcrR family transcriptional regulator [Thermaerobacter sp.]